MTDPKPTAPVDSVQLRAKLDAATPGPWRHAMHGRHEVEAEPNVLIADCGTVGRAYHDAALITALRNDVPALLEEVDQLRAAVGSAFETMLGCPVCGGGPHASGAPCICGGTNRLVDAEHNGRLELLRLRERRDALETALGEALRALCATDAFGDEDAVRREHLRSVLAGKAGV